VTIGPVVLRAIAERVHDAGAVLDCHLMVANPARHFPQIADAGGDSVTFHHEITDDPLTLVAQARALGLGVGLAFNPATAVADAVRSAEGVDLVLCMSIEPGYSGQAFLPEAFDRIHELRSALPEGVHVQVDGGVTDENVEDVRAAGANLIVAGSSVFGEGDIASAYRRLARVGA
jgi:ribulose-phosphate 3-epimerase